MLLSAPLQNAHQLLLLPLSALVQEATFQNLSLKRFQAARSLFKMDRGLLTRALLKIHQRQTRIFQIHL